MLENAYHVSELVKSKAVRGKAEVMTKVVLADLLDAALKDVAAEQIFMVRVILFVDILERFPVAVEGRVVGNAGSRKGQRDRKTQHPTEIAAEQSQQSNNNSQLAFVS